MLQDKLDRELGTKNIQISEVRGKILDISIFESYQKSNENVALLSQSEMTLAELTKMVELKKQQVNLLESRG